MTNEESNQGQAAPDPSAAEEQTPFPPSQSTPPPYPYTPAPQPPQQPVTEDSTPQNLPVPPPYSPAQQQPYPQYVAGGEPTQAYAPTPPPYPYAPPVAPKKSNRGLKILLIVLTVIVILGGTGGSILIYMLTRPQPVITVTSNYRVGTIPAGSTTTTFHIIGHKFSGSEAITFLLDGAPAPGSQAVHSDKDGNVSTDLTVDENWEQGNHTITAKDTDGYMTKISAKITIVPQGEADTPGPNGAPPDDTIGIVIATVKTNSPNNQDNQNFTQNLHITGRSDPQGGSVCGNGDDNRPLTFHYTTKDGFAATTVLTRSCGGAYKTGRLTFTETVTSAKYTFTKNGITITCLATTPFVGLHLEGTFTDATTISGGVSSDRFTTNCDQGIGPVINDAQTGTWTGTFS